MAFSENATAGLLIPWTCADIWATDFKGNKKPEVAGSTNFLGLSPVALFREVRQKEVVSLPSQYSAEVLLVLFFSLFCRFIS